eukprot:scaffold67520_cov64-Attheya_sp.AAC.2
MATGPNSVATLTEASSMVGPSASWRIEGGVGTMCQSGENSTWSVAVSLLLLYLTLWWLEAERNGRVEHYLACALKGFTEVELSPMVDIISRAYYRA